MKNANDTFGNRTHNRPAFRAVRQPTAPPRVEQLLLHRIFFGKYGTLFGLLMPQSRRNKCERRSETQQQWTVEERRNQAGIINTGNENVRKLIGQKLIVKLITVIIMGRIKPSIEQKLRQVKYLRNITSIHIQNYFCQQMHCLLKHKMLQFVLKISLYMAPTCFGPSWAIIREHTMEPC